MNWENQPSNLKEELDARRHEKVVGHIMHFAFLVVWTLGVVCLTHYYFVGRYM